jgi:hypothetical protein
MKKLILFLTTIIFFSTGAYAQISSSGDEYATAVTLPEKFIQEEIIFSTKSTCRIMTVVAVYIEKKEGKMTIYLKNLNSKIAIVITNRSVMSYGKNGFKLINESVEHDYNEEVFIISSEEMTTWLKRILEDFSGRRVPERTDPKD